MCCVWLRQSGETFQICNCTYKIKLNVDFHVPGRPRNTLSCMIIKLAQVNQKVRLYSRWHNYKHGIVDTTGQYRRQKKVK